MNQIDDVHSSHSDGNESINSAFQSHASLGSSIRSGVDSEVDLMDVGQPEDFMEGDIELRKTFEETKSKYYQTKGLNSDIQTKITSIFQPIGIKEEIQKTDQPTDAQSRFEAALSKFEVKMSELDETRSKYHSDLQLMQEKTRAADQHRIEKENEFHSLREQAGKNAILQRTNKPISQSMLNAKESRLTKAENDLESFRISYILTKNRFKQSQEELDKQDQLSEGLHLIDFEQLKIENQSLNEKKAEKTQDREKIREKIIVNSHILTHVKEKLAFVKKQKEKLALEQQAIDSEYADSRNKLALSRTHRDKVRDENSSLKKSSGLIGMTELLYDFENRANELEMMQDKVSELKTKYNDLIAMQHELEAKIAQRKPLDPTLLKMNR